MKRQHFLGLAGSVAGAALLTRRAPRAVATGPAARAGQFLATFAQQPPFSFQYGGVPSATLLARWRHTQGRQSLDASRTQHTFTWTDPVTRFQVRCVVVAYRDFPTVEWTIFFKNNGSQRSSVVSHILALDTTVQRGPATEFTLHLFNGSMDSQNDYQPFAPVLAPNDQRLVTCQGGRPTNGFLPYFNIDWGSAGVIAAIGWPGQWVAQMTRDAGRGLHLQAGMNSNEQPVLRLDLADLAALWLAPGEEVRTPLMVLQFWQGGDWIAAQNVWRRWMIAHNMPRLHDSPPPPICPTGATDGYFPGLLDAAIDEIAFLDQYVAAHTTAGSGGDFDHWWMDAGWYQVPTGATDWTWTGTWHPDPLRFPRGLRPITDRARARGMKAIVWHEPERVRPGTWLYTHHPEWLLGPGPDGDDMLMNLGNAQAWRWVVEQFDGLIRSQGVDVYRQDFNIDPIAYWNLGDPPDRRGITQIRHVTGYLAFWDELRRRHPTLLIDSCASGGRRNDLETLRRAVPLLRSDYQFEPTGQQGHTYGLSFWLPYYGTGSGPQQLGPSGSYGPGAYVIRSSLAPCFAVGMDVRSATAADWDLMRRMTREWREVASNLLGDYYPRSEYSLAGDAWIAWQFNRPETGEGVLQAFRRSTAAAASRRFTLRGLDPAATYALKNFDDATPTHMTGRELMTGGLVIQLDAPPAAATIAYRRLD
jgi:alpha-galactosidase